MPVQARGGKKKKEKKGKYIYQLTVQKNAKTGFWGKNKTKQTPPPNHKNFVFLLSTVHFHQ